LSTTGDELPDHVLRNRAHWDSTANEWVEAGERNWSDAEPSWGEWRVPEPDVGVIPSDIEGMDVIELGCGTGYVSAWLARRGAKPVGIDNSEQQLATARRLQGEHGVEFELIHGNAEEVPKPDSSFDLAISEYGASIWCDPYKWIPEARRLLRPGGRLVFLVNSPIHMLFMPDEGLDPVGETLLRPYFGMHRFEWGDDDSVEFHLPHGKMIDLLRGEGFEVEGLVELRPTGDHRETEALATYDWARKWPTEEVWKVRLSSKAG
jgi:SAM-dependent methyltransferase